GLEKSAEKENSQETKRKTHQPQAEPTFEIPNLQALIPVGWFSLVRKLNAQQSGASRKSFVGYCSRTK
ncbi:MAG: hypothetical protein R6U66_14400, partial [Bacteroidales bacterium]